MIETASVIGAGIGGLACAIALAHKGVAVTIYEQASEIVEVGAGLQVSPNGLVVLRALGVDGPLMRTGAMIAKSVVLADYKAGVEVARLDLTRMAGRPYLFAHRHDLVTSLMQVAVDAGVVLRLGQRVETIHPGDTPRMCLASGEEVQTQAVVCADGIHSIGRGVVSGGPQATFTGQVAWRATVPAQSPLAETRVSMGPGRHVVSYPLRDGSMMNLVAVEERAAWAEEGWQQSGDPEQLRAVFGDFGGPVGPLLDRVTQVGVWGLFRHPVAERWVRGNVALLGDAAHPTLPFLAQGANLALEDAWVLAQCLCNGTVQSEYQRLRRGRAVRVIDAAGRNARKYHLREGPVRSAAHFALGLGSRLAPGQMIRQFEWIYGHDVTQP